MFTRCYQFWKFWKLKNCRSINFFNFCGSPIQQEVNRRGFIFLFKTGISSIFHVHSTCIKILFKDTENFARNMKEYCLKTLNWVKSKTAHHGSLAKLCCTSPFNHTIVTRMDNHQKTVWEPGEVFLCVSFIAGKELDAAVIIKKFMSSRRSSRESVKPCRS